MALGSDGSGVDVRSLVSPGLVTTAAGSVDCDCTVAGASCEVNLHAGPSCQFDHHCLASIAAFSVCTKEVDAGVFWKLEVGVFARSLAFALDTVCAVACWLEPEIGCTAGTGASVIVVRTL